MTNSLCFDVYGSTHDQHSTPVDRLQAVTGVARHVAETIARLWADQQLRASFEVTLMDDYRTWWTLAEQALDYALECHGLAVTPAERERILDAYRHLEPYEEWAPFDRLAGEYDLYILSDGNPEMLETLAANTGFDAYLDGIVSAHAVRAFKPAPEVYTQMADHVEGGVQACTMVATHHFDVSGGLAAGMDAAYVNRFGEPSRRLGVEPDLVVDSYASLADELC